jgi:hypothetical protein
VFISEHPNYFYFGARVPDIPDRFTRFIRRGRGCRWSRPEEAQLVADFVSWLRSEFSSPGILGDPRDLGRWLPLFEAMR